MSMDGGLNKIFQAHFNLWHWQRIESGATGSGTPDLNYCAHGFEAWLELKGTDSWRIEIRPPQHAWIQRRIRAGGNVFIAARRQTMAGPRKGKAVDELYIFCGCKSEALMQSRLCLVLPLGMWADGPAGWTWPEVHNALTTKRCHH
jgi:hypothetical protein